jgi:hypothetical protein
MGASTACRRSTTEPMIIHPAFPPDQWDIRERGLDLSVLAQSESLFTLSQRSPRAARQPR